MGKLGHSPRSGFGSGKLGRAEIKLGLKLERAVDRIGFGPRNSIDEPCPADPVAINQPRILKEFALHQRGNPLGKIDITPPRAAPLHQGTGHDPPETPTLTALDPKILEPQMSPTQQRQFFEFEALVPPWQPLGRIPAKPRDQTPKPIGIKGIH